MSGKKHYPAKKGYRKSYGGAMAREGEFHSEQRKLLATEWSEDENKSTKRRCPCCQKWTRPRAYQPRAVATRFGEVIYFRFTYYCEPCRQGFCWRDAELDLEEESATDDVIAWALDLAVNDSFESSCSRLRLHHDQRISATALKHLFWRQCAPMADAAEPAPTAALPFCQDNRHLPATVMTDGSMVRHRNGWHEVKLMRIGLLGGKNDVYLAEAGEIARLEAQLLNSPGAAEMRRRVVLWLSDGALWIWNLQERLFPWAFCLLDYYHAREHAFACAKAIFDEGDGCESLFVDCIERMLFDGRVREVVEQLRRCVWERALGKGADASMEKAILDLAQYYENNQTRMDYPRFLRNGWPIGSGAVESAHRSVLQKRLKQPGMRWSEINVQRMATARALYKSAGPERFYEHLRPERVAA